MKVVIFAGGVGTRLWPLSRKHTPKQFEKIVGDQSMLQIAVKKLLPDFKWEDIYISTGKDYEELVREKLQKLPGDRISSVDDIPIFEFTGFKYRPHLSTAERFLRDGKHAWNLGYFVTTPAFLWESFEKFAP